MYLEFTVTCTCVVYIDGKFVKIYTEEVEYFHNLVGDLQSLYVKVKMIAIDKTSKYLACFLREELHIQCYFTV